MTRSARAASSLETRPRRTAHATAIADVRAADVRWAQSRFFGAAMAVCVGVAATTAAGCGSPDDPPPRVTAGNAAGAAPSDAGPPPVTGRIEGHVYVDTDHSGDFSSQDKTVAGVTVAWEGSAHTKTDLDGYFALDAPAKAGIVWVRTPDGYSPVPSWAPVPADGHVIVNLALVPKMTTTPVTFVVGSDTHIGISRFRGDDLERTFRQMAAAAPNADFTVLTGDLTQGSHASQFQTVLGALGSLDMPFVPVPGNHDWFDGGRNYRKYMGPEMYSFDVGDVHFIVLDNITADGGAGSLKARIQFMTWDLADVDKSRQTVIAFTHAPPKDDLTTVMKQLGVDYLFSGHMHTNRVMVHDSGLIEYSTQPAIMAGMDATPAGFRVVTVNHDGSLRMENKTIVEHPIVTVTYPRPADLVPRCDADVIAAVATPSTPAKVYAQIDSDAAFPLSYRGGWDWEARQSVCDPGRHRLTLRVETRAGNHYESDSTFSVATQLPPVTLGASWPQIQGGPLHTGAVAQAITPPLTTAWARSLGGPLAGGQPTIADGRVFVSLTDFNDGHKGGVAALDAASGRLLWRYHANQAIRDAPSVGGGTVTFSAIDGTVHAVDEATGNLLWMDVFGAGLRPSMHSLYASPTISNGTVYSGLVDDFRSLALAGGETGWTAAQSSAPGDVGSDASAAVASGIVATVLARGLNGAIAFDATSGKRLWQTAGNVSWGCNMSPLIAGNTVYFTNSSTVVSAIDLLSGQTRWRTQVSPQGSEWLYGTVASAAYANGLLFVPTTFTDLYAVDAQSGKVVWTYAADPSLIRPAHYQSIARAFTTAPVVTGNILWIGSTDGILRALDVDTGKLIWQTNLGSPIAMAPAPSGNTLFVATYDGVVRAMTGAPAPPP